MPAWNWTSHDIINRHQQHQRSKSNWHVGKNDRVSWELTTTPKPRRCQQSYTILYTLAVQKARHRRSWGSVWVQRHVVGPKTTAGHWRPNCAVLDNKVSFWWKQKVSLGWWSSGVMKTASSGNKNIRRHGEIRIRKMTPPIRSSVKMKERCSVQRYITTHWISPMAKVTPRCGSCSKSIGPVENSHSKPGVSKVPTGCCNIQDRWCPEVSVLTQYSRRSMRHLVVQCGRWTRSLNCSTWLARS